MEKRIINPPSLPKPRGFSHGILISGGKILFLAGQDGSGPDGKMVAPGDLVGQFEQALKNLRTVAETAGGTAADIVKLTIFVRRRDEYMSKLKELGRVYRACFGDNWPAMALFETSGFFNDGALIEIEGFAALP